LQLKSDFQEIAIQRLFAHIGPDVLPLFAITFVILGGGGLHQRSKRAGKEIRTKIIFQFPQI
jgi:hypothetical protein